MNSKIISYFALLIFLSYQPIFLSFHAQTKIPEISPLESFDSSVFNTKYNDWQLKLNTQEKDFLQLNKFNQIDGIHFYEADEKQKQNFDKPSKYMDSKYIGYFYKNKRTNPHSKIFRTFYLLATWLFFFGLIHLLYPQFFSNYFFRFIDIKKNQSRRFISSPSDILNSLSLGLSLFFYITAAWFSTLVINKYHLFPFLSNWQKFLFSLAGISIIYILKFFSIKFAGWVLQMKQIFHSYFNYILNFNRQMAVVLFFATVCMYSFTIEIPKELTANYFLMTILVILFLRYLFIFRSLSKLIWSNKFHFFLLILFIEIIPNLIIFKLLSKYLS